MFKNPIIDNNIEDFISPFKPLLKPKQISMEGGVLYSDYNFCNNAN